MQTHMGAAGRDWLWSNVLLAALIALAGTALLPTTAQAAEGQPGDDPGSLLLWFSDRPWSGGPAGWDEPLISDRPDFTEASTTVGCGKTQLEMGYTYFHDASPGEQFNAHTYPEALFRIGMFADWFELRIFQTVASENLAIGGQRGSISGATDLYIGTKLWLTPQQGIFPESSLIVAMTVPTGVDGLTNDRVLPTASLLYGWEVNEFIGIGGSTIYISTIDPATGELFTTIAQSWTINYALTEKLGMYTEWFGFFVAGAETVWPEQYCDAGFTYSVTNNVQLDVRAGVGLNQQALDMFTGTGICLRF